MKRTRKSNSVSWATGRNLCQVKLFSTDDYPAKVGLQALQDNHQAKTSSPILHSSTNEFVDSPPGFERNYFLDQPKVEFSYIPKIKWERPLPVALSSHWFVAAGEESEEKEVQKVREMRVLEAFYPRLSDIPPSPFSLYAEEEDYNDNLTPLISIIPIEEEQSIPMSISPELAAPVKPHHNVTEPAGPSSTSPCSIPLDGLCHTLGVNLETASAVVVPAIKNNNEQENPIDMDLLARILNDPIMIQHLLGQQKMKATSASASSNGLLPTPNVATIGQGEGKRKIQKPCRYFTSKRGCRNGNNCTYQHDISVQSGIGKVLRTQNVKNIIL